ncbi:Tubby-like F-box protein 6 [Gossypium arboreum]|uniref:Tubby-like F-box protein n=1 Tax=Gossypium arboreum TaxID=29729 RepID=A0A0B0MUB4_GOSAR|nr:Tubby-like F-box protein 6 [Gossypium arboreum]
MTLKFIARLRSSRVVVQDQLEVPDQAAVGGGGDGEDCCWAKLPPELLREVLLMIEDSETRWPQRKTVVACAGVCSSWRLIVKEIVKFPEISGKLTFPISVKQPGPKDGLLHCFIKRNRSTHTYCLYLSLTNALTDDGKFLLAARKHKRPTHNDYIISLRAEYMSRGSSSYVGKLRGPRRMQCIMGTIPTASTAPEEPARARSEFSGLNTDIFQSNPIAHSEPASMGNFLSGSLRGQKNGALVLINKAPRWNEQLHCWCLNFHGRVTVASVKNFQLVASPENRKIVLQFGKVGKDLFTMDYQYPISAFQAFAICLSSFDTKVACE